MVTFGPVTKKQFKLIPTGEYVFTLDDVGTTEGDYGERMVWDFFVAEKETPTEYLTKDDGSVHTLKFWTDIEVTLGSRQLEWISALTGRTFGEDDDLPDGGELLSKRMVAYLTHYTPKRGKNKGIAREDIVMGSAKPFALTTRRTGGAAKPTPATEPYAVSANATTEEIDAALAASDELRKRVKKLLRNADLDDITSLPTWGVLEDVQISNLADGDLVNLERDLKDALRSVAAA